jgi:hypothetical protein
MGKLRLKGIGSLAQGDSWWLAILVCFYHTRAPFPAPKSLAFKKWVPSAEAHSYPPDPIAAHSQRQPAIRVWAAGYVHYINSNYHSLSSYLMLAALPCIISFNSNNPFIRYNYSHTRTLDQKGWVTFPGHTGRRRVKFKEDAHPSAS